MSCPSLGSSGGCEEAKPFGSTNSSGPRRHIARAVQQEKVVTHCVDLHMHERSVLAQPGALALTQEFYLRVNSVIQWLRVDARRMLGSS